MTDYTASATMSLSWQDIHRDTRLLARMLAARGPFRGIVAIARGGLVPAAILARELDLRLVDTVCIASYDERVQGELTVLKGIEGEGEGWLVIDDLTDSGRTVLTVRAMLPRACCAAVYAKPEGRGMLDAFAVEVEQEVWLVFPWDLDE